MHAWAQVPDDARELRWAEEVAPQVVVGEVLWLATPQRAKVLALYTSAPSARGGVVIVHGLGVHPDWGLNGALRATRRPGSRDVVGADAGAGQGRDAGAVPRVVPGCGTTHRGGSARTARRGITKVAIVSHSLGAGMVDAWLAGPDAMAIAAWVPIGMLVDFAQAPREPVLDVVAGSDFPEVLASAKLRTPDSSATAARVWS